MRSEDKRKATDGALHLLADHTDAAPMFPGLKRVLNKLGCMWMHNYLMELGLSTFERFLDRFEGWWSCEVLTAELNDINRGMDQLRQNAVYPHPTNLTELMELIFRNQHIVIDWGLFPAYNKLPFPLNLILPNVAVWGFTNLDNDLALFRRWNVHVGKVKVRRICELASPPSYVYAICLQLILTGGDDEPANVPGIRRRVIDLKACVHGYPDKSGNRVGRAKAFLVYIDAETAVVYMYVSPRAIFDKARKWLAIDEWRYGPNEDILLLNL